MSILPFIFIGGFAVILFFWSRKREGEFSPDENERYGDTVVDDSMIVLGYKDGIPTQMSVAPVGNGYYLRADAASDFKRMSAACLAATGKDLPVSTAFRTMEHQERLYKELGPTLAAKPGYSNHQSGIAIDIHGLDERKPNYDKARDYWLDEHCEEYGWKRTGLNFSNIEPWHLDYTG